MPQAVVPVKNMFGTEYSSVNYVKITKPKSERHRKTRRDVFRSLSNIFNGNFLQKKVNDFWSLF